MRDDSGLNNHYSEIDVVGGYRGRGLLTRRSKLIDSIHFNKHLWHKFIDDADGVEWALSMSDFKYLYGQMKIPFKFKKEEL